VKTIEFVSKHHKEIGDTTKDNATNFYIACVISLIVSIILVLLALIILYALYSARHFVTASKNLCLFLANFLRDYIYPEEVQDDHIKGLYCEEAENIRST